MCPAECHTHVPFPLGSLPPVQGLRGRMWKVNRAAFLFFTTNSSGKV